MIKRLNIVAVGTALLMVAGSASAWVVDWTENVSGTGLGNVYYGGGVYGGQFYTGQIDLGPMAWNSTQTAGTALANSFDDTTGLNNAAKSATLLGGKVYFGGDGYLSSVDSDWSSNPVALGVGGASVGNAESVVTDGTYLYTNDTVIDGNIYKWQVNGDDTLTLVDTYATGAFRIRGISIYDGNLYAADHGNKDGRQEVYEIDLSLSGAAAISQIGTTASGAYQVARLGDKVLIISDEVVGAELNSYDIVGGNLANETAQALGLGDLYGVAFDDADGAWVTSAGSNVSYISIPEPSVISMIALFGGGMVFIRRKFMI